MAKAKTETAVSILSKEQAIKLYPSILRTEIASFVKRFDGLIITNNEELLTVRTMLTLLNKVVNKVDAERKLRGNPYKEAKSLVDEVAKEIIGNAPEVIVEVKRKIAAFEDAEERKRQVAADEAAKAQREELREIEAAQNKRLAMISDIKELAATAADKLVNARNFEQLKDAFQLHTVAVFNKLIAETQDEELKAMATEAKNRLIALKNDRKDAMAKGTQSKATNIVNDLQEIANDAMDKVVEDTQAAKAESMIHTQAEIADLSTGSSNSDRFRWEFEVEDFSKVPDAFKTVDEKAVNEYINVHKDELQDGQVVDGIKFIRKRSVVLA